MYSVEPVPGTPCAVWQKYDAVLSVSSAVLLCPAGMLLYEKLHFSAVVTVAACMVSAIALPWLFGKLIRLCRLDDIFRKIGLPA